MKLQRHPANPVLLPDPASDWETHNFEPQELWELRGDVPNVVFSCANPVMNGAVYVYYGGDHVVGLATCALDELLEYARFG